MLRALGLIVLLLAALPAAVPAAAGEDKGFVGERYDAGAGLQYLNARYYDPRLGLFLQPDWFEVTQPGVGTNRFSYSGNDPVNWRDPGGNECTEVNGLGGFCRRTRLYYAFQVKFSPITNFFGAASATTRMLADVDLFPGNLALTSKDTRNFLRDVSAMLEDLNVRTAYSIEDGSLTHPDMYGYLINLEQTNVQAALDELRSNNPDMYSKVVSEINILLNAKEGVIGAADQFYGSDAAYQRILDEARSDLGRDIDFGSQSDRETIGHALVRELEEIKNNRPDGWSGCDAAGCTWNE